MPSVQPNSDKMSYSDIYLFLYNVIQGIGWSGVLLGTGLAIFQGAPLQACFLIGAGPASKLVPSCWCQVDHLVLLLSTS
jgi:hypothetical protein